MPPSRSQKRGKRRAVKASGAKDNAVKENEVKKEKNGVKKEEDETKETEEEVKAKKEEEAKQPVGSLAKELSRMLFVDFLKPGEKVFSEEKQGILARAISTMPVEEQQRIHNHLSDVMAEQRETEVKWAMSLLGYSEEFQAAQDELFADKPQVRDQLKELAVRDAALFVEVAIAERRLDQLLADPEKNDGECMHGFDPISFRDDYNGDAYQVVKLFFREMAFGKDRGDVAKALFATLPEYHRLWSYIPALMSVQSYFLWLGTSKISIGAKYTPNMCAYCAQIIDYLVGMMREGKYAKKDTHKIMNSSLAKAHFFINADDRALISFFRKHISCNCLDERREQTKGQTKTSICYNEKCKFHMFERMEKIKTMRCSRCRSACYCSRECQVADYPRHKQYCLKAANK